MMHYLPFTHNDQFRGMVADETGQYVLAADADALLHEKDGMITDLRACYQEAKIDRQRDRELLARAETAECAVIDAGELHLADESTIFQLERALERATWRCSFLKLFTLEVEWRTQAETIEAGERRDALTDCADDLAALRQRKD